MELQLIPLTVPAVEWNKEEFRAAIAAINDRYANTVVVDKGLAKKDRATVNKVIKTVNDARKEVKKKLLAPYEAFESELKEALAPLEATGALIDTQIKAIEANERAERRAMLEQMFNVMEKPGGLELSTIFNESWLNASVSATKVAAEMHERIDAISERIYLARGINSPFVNELERMALGGSSMAEIFGRNDELIRISQEAAKLTAKIDVPVQP